MAETNTLVALVSTVIGLIFLFIIYSYGSLEPREIGILYNSFDKTIDKTPYTGGAHFIGLFNNFIHFPGGLQTIEYSSSPSSSNKPLSARTSDGVTIGLSLSFQYQLIPKELGELYMQSGTDYEKTFKNIARDVLLQVASSYQAKQFWTDREIISSSMLGNMTQGLSAAHAICKSLQMLTVTIPDNLEKKIVDVQVEKQLSSTKVYEREAELIRQDIDVMNSACEQNITAINATAEAEALFIVSSAEAAAKKRTIRINSEIIDYTIDTLFFTSSEISEYLILRSIEKQPNAVITVGINSTIIQIKSS
jgi:hypothetical protein